MYSEHKKNSENSVTNKEKETATNSSILTWEILWIEEAHGIESVESQKS